MAHTEYGVRRLDNGRDRECEDKQDAMYRVAHLRDQGIAAALITREIPDFYVTFDETHDPTALCDKPTCLHPYNRHFDLDEAAEYDTEPRVSCKYCDCMDFLEESVAKAQKAAASA